MKDEYIIINRTTIKKELEEVENNYFKVKGTDNADEHFLDGRRTSLKNILSQSTPLIPVIEDAFDEGGVAHTNSQDSRHPTTFKQDKQEYISNLKFNI